MHPRRLWFKAAVSRCAACSGGLLAEVHSPPYCSTTAPGPLIRLNSQLFSALSLLATATPFSTCSGRGAGLSADQGTNSGALMARALAEKGQEARNALQLQLQEVELGDVIGGLAFLRSHPGVDRRRVAIAGHSFGGQLTLLAAERETGVRAAVTFAAAANSWGNSPELRERLLVAVQKIQIPIFLTHAANDFSVLPGQVLAAELARLKRPHELKIYPGVGDMPAAGHGAVYSDIASWESDVFRFLDEHVRPQ